jgi:DNA (cytosine-5)-methyltransferase 1
MRSSRTKKYILNKESFENIQVEQLKLFESEFSKFGRKKTIEVDYNPRSYNVNSKSSNILESKIQTISFFSGAGGLDIGTQLAGSKVISSMDFDLDSVTTMQSNKYFSHTSHFHKDIKDVNSKSYSQIIKENNPEKLILVGGPPCQPFSKAGYWKTHEKRLGGLDPRNMIGQYLRMISELKPNGFVLENVESLLHPKNVEDVINIQETIDKLGYNLLIYKANAIEFGVPQKRKRVFFIASKKKFLSDPIKTNGSYKEILENPQLKPYEKVIDWIGKYDDEVYSDNYDSAMGKYFEDLQCVPPGQNYISLTENRGYPEPKFIAGKRYWTFLLKLHPFQPSWTIISSPGHWEGPFHWNNRRLRIKEISSIQTFPEDYVFKGSRRSIQKQIGNAVPPLLGKSIIEHLIKHL